MLPLVSRGTICSTCVHSQIHLHYMCKMCPNRSSHFTTFHSIFALLTPNPPPMPHWGIVGRIVLAYAHCKMNPQMCTKFGANRSIRLAAFPDFHFWPHKTPRKAPWGIEGRIVFSLCPLPDESADVYQMWCQSIQPFDNFPRLLDLWPHNPPSRNAPWCM